MSEIDKIIHVPARLRIMAALTTLNPGGQLDFRTLATTLDLTDGNLGAHLQTLEEAQYVSIEKSFVERKPRTHVGATSKGRTAFKAHVAALKKIIQG